MYKRIRIKSGELYLEIFHRVKINISRREAAMLRRVQITPITFYTLNLNRTRQHVIPRLIPSRLFSVQSIEEKEFRKGRHGYSPSLELDPFNLKERGDERKGTQVDAPEWDPRLTGKVRSTLEKFGISPEQIEVSPLGYSETRVLTLVQLVEHFSDQLPVLDRSMLLSVLLLKFVSVKLDTNKLKLAVQTIIDTGLDPARMLDKQPTLINLDLTKFTENAHSLINIIMEGGAGWRQLRFIWVVNNELRMLSNYAARNDQKQRSDEADLVDRMYQTGDDGRLSEFNIYHRIFQSVKKTVLARKQSDTAVYKTCEKVYSRLKRAVITELCLRHFGEVVMGICPEFMDNVMKHKGIGLKNGMWVEGFLSKVSASSILVKAEHTEEDMLSKISLLKEYGVDFDKNKIIIKYPQLLNVQFEDIQMSIEILKLSPFNLNKNDISRTFRREPSIFTMPTVLESTRQQILQIPILRNFCWYRLLKDKPRVLLINISKVFRILENHGFSDEEALTVLKGYQKFCNEIDIKSKELDKNLKPIITAVGLSQRINIIRKRISGITATQNPNSKALAPVGNEGSGMRVETYGELGELEDEFILDKSDIEIYS